MCDDFNNLIDFDNYIKSRLSDEEIEEIRNAAKEEKIKLINELKHKYKESKI